MAKLQHGFCLRKQNLPCCLSSSSELSQSSYSLESLEPEKKKVQLFDIPHNSSKPFITALSHSTVSNLLDFDVYVQKYNDKVQSNLVTLRTRA